MWYVYILDIYLLSICTGGKEAVAACFLANTLSANVHVLSDLPTQHQLHDIKYDPIITQRPHVLDLLQFAKLLSPNTALSSAHFRSPLSLNISKSHTLNRKNVHHSKFLTFIPFIHVALCFGEIFRGCSCSCGIS